MKINPGKGDVDAHTYVRWFYPGFTVLPKSLLWWAGFCLFALGFCAGSMLTEAFL